MATADQIKSLISSYAKNDRGRFYSIALQVAAHEAKKGHATLAREIRSIVDASKKMVRASNADAITFNTDLKGLILPNKPKTPLSSLILPSSLLKRFQRIIKEFYQRNKLREYGLPNRRKILLAGPPGTGKTMSAQVLAYELKLPLFSRP